MVKIQLRGSLPVNFISEKIKFVLAILWLITCMLESLGGEHPTGSSDYGIPLRDLCVWTLVSQQPVLFRNSRRQNLAGVSGSLGSRS